MSQEACAIIYKDLKKGAMTQETFISRVLRTASCLTAALVLVFIFLSGLVAAQESSSSSYKVDEVFIGSGGTNDWTSASFQARASLGDLGVGETASGNFQAYAGFTTTGAPVLEVIVSNTNLDLGSLEANTTASGTATFSVRTYLASGYVVITRGAAPTSEAGQTISPLTGGGSSTPGTEQFGMNLKDNSTPNIGTEANQLPDPSFSYGYAATGYDTADSFRYNNNDIIAMSDSSTGQTDYTISYIVNISPITEAGIYVFRQDLVVVGTY